MFFTFAPRYVEAARLLALASSTIVTYGFYDQVWKMWRTKSVRDISASLIWLSLVNEITWLNYGLALGEWPMIAVGVANLPAGILAAWAYVKYREPKTPKIARHDDLATPPKKPAEI